MIKVGRNILDLVSMNVDVMSIYSGNKIFMDGEESVVSCNPIILICCAFFSSGNRQPLCVMGGRVLHYNYVRN